VDGGGSTCRARLADEHGDVLGEGRAGPANVFYDPEGSWRAIETAVRAAYLQAGVDPAERQHTAACFGLAGLDPVDPQAPADWPLDIFRSCIIESDALIALRGAHAGKDGAVLVVGTGSVGLAAVGAELIVVGGYGATLSDEGSGNWLGREAVRHMLWSVDGRLPWSSLTLMLHQKLGGARDTILWARSASAADFAELAPAVLSAARGGDATAAAIVEKGAALLNRMIFRLASSGAEHISLLGGLSEPWAPWLDASRFRVSRPEGDALSGALLLAAEAVRRD
jgi:glucosamine kinase